MKPSDPVIDPLPHDALLLAAPPEIRAAPTITPSSVAPAPDAAANDPATKDISTLLAEPSLKSWYRRPLVWFGTLLVLLIAGFIWWWMARHAQNALPVYNTQPVARGNITLTVTANGTLQPIRSINIGSELSGTVLKVNVDVNDQVRKGDALLVLDPAKLNDQILRSTATLDAAKSKVAQTTATVREATASLNRLNEVSILSAGKVPSKAELDTGRATLDRATADGIILTRTVDPGNAVAASLQAVTLFTLADDLSKLRLWVYVDEADVGAVKVGQHATFTVSAYLSRQFPAKITRVGFGSTITDAVVTYLTYLDVDNADMSLRPGMTATASIIAAQRNNVMLVPNTALRFMPGTTAAATKTGMASSLIPHIPGNTGRKSAATSASTALAKQVWILRDKTAVAVAVTPGISDGHMTEITGGDLQLGMLVITDQQSTKVK